MINNSFSNWAKKKPAPKLESCNKSSNTSRNKLTTVKKTTLWSCCCFVINIRATVDQLKKNRVWRANIFIAAKYILQPKLERLSWSGKQKHNNKIFPTKVKQQIMETRTNIGTIRDDI